MWRAVQIKGFMGVLWKPSESDPKRDREKMASRVSTTEEEDQVRHKLKIQELGGPLKK